MNGYFVNLERQTIDDAITGRTLFSGIQDFYENITKVDRCFSCGAARDTKPFNYEHVIPNWILRRFELHNEFINLGNG